MYAKRRGARIVVTKKRKKPRPPKRPLTEAERKKRQKRSIIIGIVILSVAFGGTFGVYYILQAAMGTEYPVVVVTSESMEPTIERGDILFIQAQDPATIVASSANQRDGDVILYETAGLWPNPVGEPVVHRVVEKYYDNATGQWMFRTQGDNRVTNPRPDPYPVPESHVIGVVVGRIPKLGHVKLWLSDTNLATPLIVILGALLVITIVYDILHPEEEEEKGKEKSKENGKEKITTKQAGKGTGPSKPPVAAATVAASMTTDAAAGKGEHPREGRDPAAEGLTSASETEPDEEKKDDPVTLDLGA